MWGNQVMAKKAWDMEVDVGEGQCRINNPTDGGPPMLMSIVWDFAYTDDGNAGRQYHMMEAQSPAVEPKQQQQQLEPQPVLHPKLAAAIMVCTVLVMAQTQQHEHHKTKQWHA